MTYAELIAASLWAYIFALLLVAFHAVSCEGSTMSDLCCTASVSDLCCTASHYKPTAKMSPDSAQPRNCSNVIRPFPAN